MAGLSGAVTVADIVKTMNPDGTTAIIAELLHQTNAFLDDIPWIASNDSLSHQTTVRTSLPTPTWRTLNTGSSPSKASTSQIVDSMGILESWSEVDKDVAEINGNEAKFRMQHAEAHIEAMGQEFMQTLWYGNSGTAPNEFNGLSRRYNALTGNIGDYVISGGGNDTDLTSIWLVCWNQDKIAGIYPRGTQAGLQHDDLGLVPVTTTAGVGSAGARMMAYLDHFTWKGGLMVADYRYAVRICNLDQSAMVANSSAPDLFDFMIRASTRLKNPENGNCVWYMNRITFEYMQLLARNDVQSGGMLGYDNVGGKRVTTVMGWPVRISDQLVDESTIS